MKIIEISIPNDLSAIRRVVEQAFAASADANIDSWFSFEEMQQNIGINRGCCLKAIDENGTILGAVCAQAESPINDSEALGKWVTNAATEGLNNYLRYFKRVSFGQSNFEHTRL